MKLTIDKSVLAGAVSWTAGMLPARAATPILSGVMLTADSDGLMAGGTLALSMFDYERSGRSTVAADVAEPGTVLVSGRMLADIVRSLPARPVELVTDGSKVRITCGSAKFTLLTMPSDDYPSMPKMPDGAGTVDSDAFAAAVGQVSFAASKEDSPASLMGVRIEVSGDRVTMFATDRYRLAVKEFGWRPSSGEYVSAALVKGWALSETAKGLPAGTDVTVGLGDLIGFEVAGRRSTSLLMEDQYPAALGLFPKVSTGYAVVNRADLIETVMRVSLVTERKTAVRLAFEDGSLEVSGGHGEDAYAEETVPADVTGPGIVQGFNPAYLMDGLKAVPQQFVRFTYLASGEGASPKPAVLTGQADEGGEDDKSYRYLIMPQRL